MKSEPEVFSDLFVSSITRVHFQWVPTLSGNLHSLVRVSGRVEENIEIAIEDLHLVEWIAFKLCH